MGGTNKAVPYCGCGAEAGDTGQCGAGTEGGEGRRRASALGSSQDQLPELGGNGMILTALSPFAPVW